MRLTLKIENQDVLPPGQAASQTLDRKGLQIGRAADVDWTLSDPQKLISSVHAEIKFRDGVFMLRDKSRNGTFLNGARVDSATREVRLNDGDRIAIGHYEMSVAIEGDGPGPGALDQAPAESAGDVWGGDWGSAAAPAEPIPVEAVRTPVGFGASVLERPYQAPTVQGQADAQDWGGWLSPEPAAPAPAPAAPVEAPRAARPAPPSYEPPVPPPAPVAFGADDASRALAAFLRGAGLPADAAVLRDVQAFEQAGLTLRVLVHGLFDLLKRQSEMKSVLGLERTMIQLADNNTLKFSASGDEALQRIMAPRTGDLPGPSAAKRSFDDVRRHEERLLTAMNEAVRSIVERLSPQEIKRRETGGVMTKLIPNSSKASWWDELEREHARLLESDAAKLDELIEGELREAFEKHL
jgi:type VI secretion system FHA domain protein